MAWVPLSSNWPQRLSTMQASRWTLTEVLTDICQIIRTWHSLRTASIPSRRVYSSSIQLHLPHLSQSMMLLAKIQCSTVSSRILWIKNTFLVAWSHSPKNKEMIFLTVLLQIRRRMWADRAEWSTIRPVPLIKLEITPKGHCLDQEPTLTRMPQLQRTILPMDRTRYHQSQWPTSGYQSSHPKASQ
jgi:hypothetical protein